MGCDKSDNSRYYRKVGTMPLKPGQGLITVFTYTTYLGRVND